MTLNMTVDFQKNGYLTGLMKMAVSTLFQAKVFGEMKKTEGNGDQFLLTAMIQKEEYSWECGMTIMNTAN